jgi:hypothetical protein
VGLLLVKKFLYGKSVKIVAGYGDMKARQVQYIRTGHCNANRQDRASRTPETQ